MSKKAPTFREEMNCQPKSLSIQAILKSVPTGSGEFTPDKPIKKGVRWNKTPGLKDDGGTVDEAGTSNPSGMRGCQLVLRYLGYVGWAELYFALAFIPTGASIVFLLASSLLWDTGSGPELRKTLRSVVAPAIFLYLFLAAASSLMASVLKIPVSWHWKDLVLGLYLLILWRLVARSSIGEGALGTAVKRFGGGVGLFGFGLLAALVNPYAGMVFELLSAVVLAFAVFLFTLLLVQRLSGKDVSQVVAEEERNYPVAVVMMFFLLALYALWLSSAPSAYRSYVLLALVVLLVLFSFASFFREYLFFSGKVEGLMERIYQQHEKEVKQYLSEEDQAYSQMVKEFLLSGKKERLIAYVSYRLALCGASYSELIEILKPLLQYSFVMTEAPWPWQVEKEKNRLSKELQARKDLLKHLYEAIDRCQEKVKRSSAREKPLAARRGCKSPLVGNVTAEKSLPRASAVQPAVAFLG